MRKLLIGRTAEVLCVLALAAGCGSQPSTVVPAPAAAASVRIAPKDGMAQVYVPAGEFFMGSTDADIAAAAQSSGSTAGAFRDETPQHRVYLGAYWMDRYEVTNAMFMRFVAETGYLTEAERLGGGIVLDMGTREWKMVQGADWRHPRGPSTDIQGRDDHPVVQVTYGDARAYCLWAGRRLPTEAEWEKAARGTDGRIYPWGNQPPAGHLLNFADRNSYNSMANLDEDDGYEFTAPVGSYPDGASPYGVMDMAGNVSEWVADRYSASYYSQSPARDPKGPSTGDAIQFRGGSWSRKARYLRAAARYAYVNGNRSSGIGFRCVSAVSTAGSRTADFDAIHTPVDGGDNQYLIFGGVPIDAPAADLPSSLRGFLGRWEGYGFFPPVQKDWKYVLVGQKITTRGGRGFFWAGTNLQYPRWVEEISFTVDAGASPSIRWELTDRGVQTAFSFALSEDGAGLLGRQAAPARNSSLGPIRLEKGRSFIVYKDYARYLAEKRITPRLFRDAFMPVFYGRGYLLYLPPGYEAQADKRWPLMIFLHGSGDRGYNLFLLAKASPFMMVREKAPLPFIILAPLLSTSEFYASFSDDYMGRVLDEALADYRVDRGRIYVTGLSMGGEAAYRFALKRPEVFAAIAPLSAFLSPVPEMGAIKYLPVWAVHGENDPVVPLAVGRKPVDALIQAGGNVRFSVLPGHDHDVWTDTYSDPAFYDWLLQHERR